MYKFKDIGLKNNPDFSKCMERVYAWYEWEIFDRVPVRFSAHNSDNAVDTIN